MKRKCGMCKECKELEAFRFVKSKNKYQSYCKKCENIYLKEWKKAYREIHGVSYGYTKKDEAN